MSGALQKLRELDDEKLRSEFLVCCHAAKWADKMTAAKPLGSKDALFKHSGDVWVTMDNADLMEV